MSGLFAFGTLISVGTEERFTWPRMSYSAIEPLQPPVLPGCSVLERRTRPAPSDQLSDITSSAVSPVLLLFVSTIVENTFDCTPLVGYS